MIKEKTPFVPIEYPLDLKIAIASAFFGGRFEISKIGPVRQKCFSYDIASAYPYAFTFLPCLVHGKWELVSNPRIEQIEQSSAALIRYELPYTESLGKLTKNGPECFSVSEHASEFSDESYRSDIPWGPFPLRKKDGNIIYPVTSGGGWLWKDEIIIGLKYFPNVVLKEAWLYNTSCDCEVLRASMPQKYILRLEWGKEGKGIVVKLGCNSCYGKAAQSRGKNPPFQNFIWAGMTTSSCRAQVLDPVGRYPNDILMIATDGIVADKQLSLPSPRDTGTYEAARAKDKYPLGAWEPDVYPDGIMLIRPGVGFPLGKKSKDKEIKARGVGKSILKEKVEKVMEQWEKFGPDENYSIKRPIFYGMKSCIRRRDDGRYTRDLHVDGNKMNYGTWADQTVKITYDALPKRPFRKPDFNLATWAMPVDCVSNPYGPALGKEAVLSLLAKQLQEMEMVKEDQADKDETDTEFEV